MVTIESIPEKVRRLTAGTAIDLLILLLTTIEPLVQDSNHACPVELSACFRDVWKRVSDCTRVVETKEARKGPFKKKAPPKKNDNKSLLVQSSRFALFWTPVSGLAPNIPTSVSDSLPKSLVVASSKLDLKIKRTNDILGIDARNIFDPVLTKKHWSILEDASNVERVDRWFKKPIQKQTLHAVVAGVTEDALPEGGSHKKRHSVLGPVMSQRISIMLHSLKKSLRAGSTTQVKLESAILQCSLRRDEITLLADAIPNMSDVTRGKKHLEWEGGVKALREHLSLRPMESLLEEERFVLFIDAIPSFHRRLACMFVTSAFDAVIGAVKERLVTLISAFKLLVKSPMMHTMWSVLLAVGNLLNENTTRGRQSYFKLSALKRAAEVRGNDGITLPEYLSAYFGSCYAADEWKLLCRAREAGVIQTFVAAENLCETILTIMGWGKELGNELPDDVKDRRFISEDEADGFNKTMAEFGQSHREVASDLAKTFLDFVQWYTSSAHFFTDADVLLPIQAGVDGNPESEESPARDLLLKITTFLAAVRSQKGARQKVQPATAFSPSETSEVLQENILDQSKVNNILSPDQHQDEPAKIKQTLLEPAELNHSLLEPAKIKQKEAPLRLPQSTSRFLPPTNAATPINPATPLNDAHVLGPVRTPQHQQDSKFSLGNTPTKSDNLRQMAPPSAVRGANPGTTNRKPISALRRQFLSSGSRVLPSTQTGTTKVSSYDTIRSQLGSADGPLVETTGCSRGALPIGPGHPSLQKPVALPRRRPRNSIEATFHFARELR